MLGTVSGLILASSGAVAHDLLGGVLGMELSGHQQVRVAKIAAVVVGVIAIVLGHPVQRDERRLSGRLGV